MTDRHRGSVQRHTRLGERQPFTRCDDPAPQRGRTGLATPRLGDWDDVYRYPSDAGDVVLPRALYAPRTLESSCVFSCRWLIIGETTMHILSLTSSQCSQQLITARELQNHSLTDHEVPLIDLTGPLILLAEIDREEREDE